ncbi:MULTISPECIES: C40 family peptidase [Halobacillus]|uniref:Gamma-DL-glutamyl hydrolase n=1 Tax=Halobacillus halophilus (strain ATCC 35676 / DSM 2266 / JCM 20832 / KCTC 3685 / LMG 17431 / NBRC 102448 / NCIMB 2269) TaxID=866895 RepID=I0JQV7_HALH3|nr:C40 family peptidase [Halobacillus halophilus]ASF40529.1 bifunctional murein DD-endopeptidase/murein LD-carboxypeptidase [Halobacillus halophilus]CCG46527.1 gamma-DL-glutamyl hydrolase [Halobacillus halophilus DSM 2266]
MRKHRGKWMTAITLMVISLVVWQFSKDDREKHPLVEEAEIYIGVDYEQGGASPKQGFDSSGFIQYIFQQVLEFELPRTLEQQKNMGEQVERDALQEGDVLFFSKDDEGLTHAAIYMGKDQIIHPTVSDGVEVTSFEGDSYWSGNFEMARRITDAPEIAREEDLVQTALQYLGVPYLFGGETPEAFDCSGLIQYVFEEAKGIYLPRSTDQQWQVGEKIDVDNIQPGDVIFFSDTYRDGISHNGIYIGGGRFLHASRTQEVTISYLSGEYWQEKFTGVKRFEDLTIPREDPIVSEATKYIGEVPYQKDGTTPAGFDTAGFVEYVMEKVGMSFPRRAEEQWEVGESVEKDDLQPGDLVFLKDDYLNPAFYIGNHQIVHVTLAEGVEVTNLKSNEYWGPKYYGAKRVD